MADTGQAGLDLLAAKRFDLVFSDVILPGGISGVDIARHTLVLRPETPVLLTSGYTAQRIDLSELPNIGLLSKPYSMVPTECGCESRPIWRAERLIEQL